MNLRVNPLCRLPAAFRPLARLLSAALSLAAANAAPPADSHVTVAGWQLQDVAKVNDNAETLARPGYATAGWYKATVPGTVLTTLVANGVYPEPLYGLNNLSIPESLCRTSYWYRAEPTIPAAFAGRQVWLDFEGVNYIAEVWVNATRVGEIRGAFTRGRFNVTSLVKPGSPAAIAVLIQPPKHPAVPHEQTQAGGAGLNGGVHSKDGPAFICTQGWDWIPGIRDRDMGIWRAVTLRSTGPVVIENPLVFSRLPLPRTDEADVTIEATVRNVTAEPRRGVLKGSFEGVQFSLDVALAANEAKTIRLTPASTPSLHLKHPRLWWPNGYGEPNLYAITLGFAIGRATSDETKFNFGIREISYQLPGSDNLALSVNGVPVMCRGGNWGMDEAMKRIPRERLEAQIRFHQLANCNMIRNWVGQSTTEDFYDLCDRFGIMVWDEFFQPNPSDSGRTVGTDGSGDIADIPMYLANAREKVLRFRSHPSIALWCGRNEGDPSPEAVADGLKNIMAELEPVRLYHPNSADGRGVRSGGPYQWRTPREYFLPPTRRGADPSELKPENLEPFKTEIGSVSIPTLEAVKAMLPEKDWNDINDDWAYHDLCKGAQNGPRYIATLTERYGAWKDLAGFVRASQLACYESHRAMFEGRFARLFNPCAGALAWMSNPSQPSFVWQFYSYDLEPIAALYAVKKACEPLHVQLNQTDFHVAVINQRPAAAAGLKVRVRVLDLDGSVKLDRTSGVAAKASAATDAGAVEIPAGVAGVHFVRLDLLDASGRVVSNNLYWRGTAAAPDDFRALDSLPRIPVQLKVARHDAGGKCLLDVTLTNSGPTVALLSHIQLRRERSGDRVLPVYYSDNYISLLPGESRTVSVEADARDLRGEAPLVALDGWNVASAR